MGVIANQTDRTTLHRIRPVYSCKVKKVVAFYKRYYYVKPCSNYYDVIGVSCVIYHVYDFQKL